MDHILLTGISCMAKVGVHSHERELGCPCEIDLHIGFDLRQAAQTDQLQDTLDYAAVCREVIDLAENGHFNLLERLASEVAHMILRKSGVQEIRVLLKKKAVPGLPGLKYAGVEITRQNL